MIRLDPPELVAARRRRVERVAGDLGLDGWLLTSTQGVRAVTGAWSDETDLIGEWASPIVAVGDLVVEAPLPTTDPAFADAFVGELPGEGTIAVDRLGASTLARLAQLRPKLRIEDATALLRGSKAPREPIEIEVMAEAHRRTEAALAAMLPTIPAGVSERELNAEFTLRALDQGLEHLHVDTAFSVLPASRAEAPWAHGEWAARNPYRELTTERVVRDGDHLAFDTGVGLKGYIADVGWTLLVGDRQPTPAEIRLAERWDEVAQRVIDALAPGASAADLREAALRGWDPQRPPPWPHPFYVAHGIGTDAAEPPFAGAGFPAEAEGTMLVENGHVLMIEPYIWEEGTGGYRAEYCVAVDSSGCRILSSLPYGHWPGTS